MAQIGCLELDHLARFSLMTVDTHVKFLPTVPLSTCVFCLWAYVSDEVFACCLASAIIGMTSIGDECISGQCIAHSTCYTGFQLGCSY